MALTCTNLFLVCEKKELFHDIHGVLVLIFKFSTALLKNNIRVVQASLLGSVLVNLLLVLGSAIIAGGVISPDQTYNNDVTHSFVGLLNLTVSCLMIPVSDRSTLKSSTDTHTHIHYRVPSTEV